MSWDWEQLLTCNDKLINCTSSQYHYLEINNVYEVGPFLKFAHVCVYCCVHVCYVAYSMLSGWSTDQRFGFKSSR